MRAHLSAMMLTDLSSSDRFCVGKLQTSPFVWTFAYGAENSLEIRPFLLQIALSEGISNTIGSCSVWKKCGGNGCRWVLRRLPVVCLLWFDCPFKNISIIYSAETADWLWDGSTLFHLQSTCFIILSAFALLLQKQLFSISVVLSGCLPQQSSHHFPSLLKDRPPPLWFSPLWAAAAVSPLSLSWSQTPRQMDMGLERKRCCNKPPVIWPSWVAVQ